MAKLYDYVLKKPKVTSDFGKRTHPITKKENVMHNGVDLTSSDKNIYAIEEGYVQKVVTGQDKATTGYGNYIWVRYPRINLSLFHAHCKSVKLKKGDKVKKGDIIAVMGKTGASTGVHLHLGMTKIGSDTWLNPQTYDYIPEEEKVVEKEIIEVDETQKLEEEIRYLSEKVANLEVELAIERQHKLKYNVTEKARYTIDADVGETIIVK